MHFTPLLVSTMTLLGFVAAAPVEIATVDTVPIDSMPSDTVSIDVDSITSNPEAFLEKRITYNTQSCRAKQYSEPGPGGFGNRGGLDYTIYIGIYFNKGTGCNSLKNGIGSALGNWRAFSSSFHCDSYDNGASTELKFKGPFGRGGALNTFLHKAYPTVNGFNCPSK